MPERSVVVITSISVCVFAVLIFQYSLMYDSSSKEFAQITSSVWCHRDEHSNLKCKFKNICYLSNVSQFIFILKADSVLSGLNNKTDLNSIRLSSVMNHNNLSMKIAVVNEFNLVNKSYTFIQDPVFILRRFKHDNIMHVIHDDLMPLYFRYAEICMGNVDACISKYKLVFFDYTEIGPFDDWYSIFSDSYSFLNNVDGTVCFKEAVTGLSTDSLWYQYGFGRAQGPISDTKITGSMIQQFSNFIINKMKIQVSKSSNNNILLFNRTKTRKIINIDFVISSIKDVHKHFFPLEEEFNVFVVDLSVNRTDVLKLILESKMIVGMHGSEMILSIFLKAGSMILELFPYAISPDNVSAMKALSDLPSVGLLYKSWQNTDVNNTIPHPEAIPLHGGILHLDKNAQKEIKTSSSVPAVQCCHNATYLYRMFQDTIVSQDFIPVFKELMNKYNTFSLEKYESQVINFVNSQWWYPAQVSHVSCMYIKKKQQVVISWSAPINTKSKNVCYSVAAMTVDQHFHTSITTNNTHVSFVLPIVNSMALNIWIISSVENVDSMDVFSKCFIEV